MSDKPPESYDFFVSYASEDNRQGWVTQFVEHLLAEHRRFAAGRELKEFFDRRSIRPGADWEHTLHHGIAASRLFLAFISPNYFASEWCRHEWRAWMEQEIAKHILTQGVRPVYLVEVPGLVGKAPLKDLEVAAKVAELCQLNPAPVGFAASAGRVVGQVRRRQLLSDFAKPFQDEGLDALRREDLRQVLEKLAHDLDEHADLVARAAKSISTVPPYNKKFTGRLEELLALRKQLADDQAGVVCGIHGLGGLGKTELAFAYAHAYASAYPAGRFLIRCEGQASIRDAVLAQGDFTALFREQITDTERQQPDVYFGAVLACLRQRLDQLGHVLVVLDNVSDAALLTRDQTGRLTALGPNVHLLATTRLMPPASGKGNWFKLGQLPEEDAVQLLEKHRPFASAAEAAAARRIARQLGGFTLAVELVAAYLAAHEDSANYALLADGLGLQDLEDFAEDETVELCLHNHPKRLSAVLGPVLARLKPVERRTLEYAALLPAEMVPLPWLETLVRADFPEVAQAGRLSDPWRAVWERLEKLALFTRPEEETTAPRLMRIHRLVQDLVLTTANQAKLQQAVDGLVAERDGVLQKTTKWTEDRWEIPPLAALANRWDETNHPRAAWLLNEAGRLWHSLAEWSQAEPLMRRALAIDEQSFGPDHPEVAADLNNLAQLLQATNRLAEAEPLMRRALAIDEQSFGPDHPNVATRLNNLATLLKATNRLAEAEPLMRRALAIDEQSFGPDHPNVAMSLNNLALLLQATNRLAEAEPLMRQMVEIFLKFNHATGHQHPHLQAAVNNYAGFRKQWVAAKNKSLPHYANWHPNFLRRPAQPPMRPITGNNSCWRCG